MATGCANRSKTAALPMSLLSTNLHSREFMNVKNVFVAALTAATLIGTATGVQAQSFSEGFNAGTLPTGWVTVNRSTTPNNTTGGLWRTISGITDGASPPATLVSSLEGSSFAAVAFNSTTSSLSVRATISNWMLSPVIAGLSNGDVFRFFTTTTPGSSYADRLEVRLSTAGSGTDVGTTPSSVGSFTTLLNSINPSLAVGGYPEGWTQVSAVVSGLSAPTTGRVAFRYFVTDGGQNGNNSNIIGVDQFNYVAAIPEPGTWLLMLGGIAAVIGVQRRRSAQARMGLPRWQTG